MVHVLLAAALAIALSFSMPAKAHSTHTPPTVTALDCADDPSLCVYSPGGPPG